MGKEIVCVAEFQLQNGMELSRILKDYVIQRGENSNTYIIVATDSTCNMDANDLKLSVIDTIKELNPVYIRGICAEELLDDGWYRESKTSAEVACINCGETLFTIIPTEECELYGICNHCGFGKNLFNSIGGK